MSNYDLILRNGRVLTATTNDSQDIAIRNGKIADIGQIDAHADTEIDATNKVITPGGVDAHAHIEQMSGMGLMNADTFETATRSAALGGTTSVISFAPQTMGITLRAAVADYAARARRGASIDHAFHIILNDLAEPNVIKDLGNLIAAGHRSIKIFTTYNIKLSDRDICDVLAVAREAEALVCVHAENDGLIGWTKSALLANGKTQPKHHAISHPRLAEIEAVDRLIRFAEYFATPVMLFHISTHEAVASIRAARARGVPVWAETCPHYLFMTDAALEKPGLDGAKWMCSPPQRTQDDQIALFDGLADGTLDLVSSDHAPYRFDDTGNLSNGPKSTFAEIANGLPGLEVRMPLMFDAMQRGKITSQQFVTLCCTAPAQIHGLANKGDIAIGYDADLVIWEPDAQSTYGDNDLGDNVGYNPWHGRQRIGQVDSVYLRGTPVVSDGAFVGSPGSGQWLSRDRMGVTTDAAPADEYTAAIS